MSKNTSQLRGRGTPGTLCSRKITSTKQYSSQQLKQASEIRKLTSSWVIGRSCLYPHPWAATATFLHVWRRAAMLCVWMVNSDLKAPQDELNCPPKAGICPRSSLPGALCPGSCQSLVVQCSSPLSSERSNTGLCWTRSPGFILLETAQKTYTSPPWKSWMRATEGQRGTESERCSSPNLGVKCRQVKVQLWAFSVVVCTDVPSPHKQIYCVTFMFSNHLLMK